MVKFQSNTAGAHGGALYIKNSSVLFGFPLIAATELFAEKTAKLFVSAMHAPKCYNLRKLVPLFVLARLL